MVTSWEDQGKETPTILAQRATIVSMTEATMWTIPATSGYRLPKEGGQSASRMNGTTLLAECYVLKSHPRAMLM